MARRGEKRKTRSTAVTTNTEDEAEPLITPILQFVDNRHALHARIVAQEKTIQEENGRIKKLENRLKEGKANLDDDAHKKHKDEVKEIRGKIDAVKAELQNIKESVYAEGKAAGWRQREEQQEQRHHYYHTRKKGEK